MSRKCQGEAVFAMKLKAKLFSMTMSTRDIYLTNESQEYVADGSYRIDLVMFDTSVTNQLLRGSGGSCVLI